MGICDGRIVIVTGAGRGIGREHALAFAAEGARVVVNDLGTTGDGQGRDEGPADEVVAAIRAAGGEAIAHFGDIADWEGARSLVATALNTFGGLDVLVNNAGFVRDRMLFTSGEDEWDAVIRVHLKGHFAPTRFAAAYWREQSKAGKEVNAAIINTSSTSGLLGNPGQANYGAAKSGIATFSQIVAMELKRYGVRSNAIAPAARTRMTESTPGLSDVVKKPEDAAKFDVWNPANVSPMVAYLATADCPFSGEAFLVQGDTVQRFQPWTLSEKITNNEERWTVAQLQAAAPTGLARA